jgi:hypothetical protein
MVNNMKNDTMPLNYYMKRHVIAVYGHECSDPEGQMFPVPEVATGTGRCGTVRLLVSGGFKK